MAAQGVPRKRRMNWEDLRGVGGPLNAWGVLAREPLVLVFMDKSAAAAYSNYGSRRSSGLTALARSAKHLEIVAPRTLVALRMAG